MTYQNDPSSSQKPNLVLMLFTWYSNILFIIESFRKQDFNLQMPNEYDYHSHSQSQADLGPCVCGVFTLQHPRQGKRLVYL